MSKKPHIRRKSGLLECSFVQPWSGAPLFGYAYNPTQAYWNMISSKIAGVAQ